MNIYSFRELVNMGHPYIDLLKSIQAKRLVPVLGSGFTAGLSAKSGIVPTADQLKDKMIEMMAKYGGYSEEETVSIKEKDLSAVSDFFIDAYTDTNGELACEDAHNEFSDYMEMFYSRIHDLPSYQREFLQCGWPYLYTLNYDDALESVLSSYQVVIPYKKLNTSWLKNHQCIIKLHGDVTEFLKTDDIKYCILSKKQYIASIAAFENKDLRDWLRDDCSSNDLLFIGCSLTNEYDILFAASGDNLEKLSKDTGKTSYYIYYDKNPGKNLTLSEQKILRGYGIENVIRVTPEEMGEFYLCIKNMCVEANKLASVDKLGKYCNFKFSRLDADNEKNISYFFYNSALGIGSEKQEIVLPTFFIRRDAGQQVVKYIEAGTSICLLSGNRFSGKTYILLDLLKTMQSKKKKVYLITGIPIADRMLESIFNKNDCLFLFDSGTLTNYQLRKFFYDRVQVMKEQNLQIVYVVNRSDRNFLKSFGNIPFVAPEDMQICPVDTRLFDSEIDEFNKCIKGLSLSEREKKETFLDYAIRIDGQSKKKYKNILPDTNVLSPENTSLVKCVVVLATYPAFDNDTANMLDIRDELSFLCEEKEKAVQKDYISDLEKNWGTHSGVKFVCNSTYWLYRCLSNFAKTKSHYEVISKVFKDIIERYFEKYTRSDGTLDVDIFFQIKPYYYLDTLQRMFFCDAPDKGSLELPETIYTKLKGILGDEYQFLHQTAKCKLRLSRRYRDDKERCLDILEMVNRIINRAYGLAQKAKGTNLEYTLAHMNVTQALILTNCLRYCELISDITSRNLHAAVQYYYNIYVYKSAYVGDVNGGLDDRDLSDVKWFMECFIDPKNYLRNWLTDDGNRKMIQDVLSRYYKRSIKIDW